jgi:hypothetical protein
MDFWLGAQVPSVGSGGAVLGHDDPGCATVPLVRLSSQ